MFIGQDLRLQLSERKGPDFHLSGSVPTTSQVYRIPKFYLNNPSLHVTMWKVPGSYLTGSASTSSQLWGVKFWLKRACVHKFCQTYIWADPCLRGPRCKAPNFHLSGSMPTSSWCNRRHFFYSSGFFLQIPRCKVSNFGLNRSLSTSSQE